MDGDAHDLFIESETEENFGDIGSQGNDPLGRKREAHFSPHFIYELLGRRIGN
jgi:hypothetical protein